MFQSHVLVAQLDESSAKEVAEKAFKTFSNKDLDELELVKITPEKT